jgi:hypothetical protein
MEANLSMKAQRNAEKISMGKRDDDKQYWESVTMPMRKLVISLKLFISLI